jgi:hypothetical protein
MYEPSARSSRALRSDPDDVPERIRYSDEQEGEQEPWCGAEQMIEPEPDQDAADQTPEQLGENAVAEASSTIVFPRLARSDRLFGSCAA